MIPRKPRHIHKYHRIKIGRSKDYIVYACALPDCPHYLPIEQIVGKLTVCWRCGETCQIRRDRRGDILHKPHCLQCTTENRNPAYRKHRKATPSKNASVLANLLLSGAADKATE